MVSGRVPAPLDVLALLAARLEADLAKPRAHRRGGTANRREQGVSGGAAWRDRLRARDCARPCRAGLRGSCRVAGQRGQSAGERLAGEFSAQGPRGAPPHRPRFFARADRAFGLCPAGPALAGEGRRDPLAQREMENPARGSASGPRRQPRRLPFAAGRPALRAAVRVPLCRRSRSDRAARPIAGFPRCARARPAGRLVRRGGRVSPGARRAAPRRYRRRRTHRGDGRAARRAFMRFPASGRTARGLSRTGRRRRSGGRKGRAAGADRRLPASGRSAHERHSRRARSRRDRGQHPSRGKLARMRRHHRDRLRGGAAFAPRRRQVHDRRQACRDRRGQSRCRRRADAARQPVPKASRPAQEPHHLLVASPEPQLLLLGPVHWADQPGAAHRRSASRRSLRAGNRARADPEARRWRCAAAVAARPAHAQPAHRRNRQHPSGGNLHRQALFARRTHGPPRPRGVPRLRNAAGFPHESRLSSS